MITSRVVTFFVVISLFLWVPTVTVKHDLKSKSNQTVELVEHVESFEVFETFDEKVVTNYLDLIKPKTSPDVINDTKTLTWLLAFEVITPPPDLS